MTSLPKKTAKYLKNAKSWNRRGATPPIFATLQGPGPTLHRGRETWKHHVVLWVETSAGMSEMQQVY